ncbi:trypsin-like serine protease [Planotetraspora kaengkrachanensis]|uniref:trypsin-like serine protease n=1 Tax=Planotetraspora kaengkrachanensis TaxID=575193 RepID=UPI00194352B0|nr:trypsin-like serine protease [Planotetraspora kaengkrachanensis]
MTDTPKEAKARTQQVRAEAEKRGITRKSVRQGTATSSTQESSALGTPAPRPQIVGGSATTISAAPYVVQLWYQDANRPDYVLFYCAGTLIAPNKVLTAAHCVSGLDWVHKGEVDGGVSTLSATNYKWALVKRQWVNPSYNKNTLDNDIAILTLDRPMPLSVAPIAMGSDAALYKAGTKATVFGWGTTTSAPAGPSNVLKKATLPIQADSTCDAALRDPEAGDQFVNGHMICAGPPGTGTDSTTTSTCPGDSGGPLLVSGKVVGIVSWGVGIKDPATGEWIKNCGVKGTYPVFTRVNTYAGIARARTYDTDYTGDGNADVFARATKGGTARVYKGKTLATYSSVGSGYGSWNKMLQTDLNRDGLNDYIVRTTAGNLYWRHKSGSKTVNTKISSSYKTVKQIITPGDVTGDLKPDLMSVTSKGYLYVYGGKGNGTFVGAKRLSTGWLAYAQVIGHGDYTGDGRPDLIGRTSKGAVYVHPGNSKGTFFMGTRKLVSSTKFKTAKYFLSPGDVDGDGKSDIVTVLGNGYMYLYKGDGKGNFAGALRVRTGLKPYNLFG